MKGFYVKINADKLVFWYSKLTGTRGQAKAIALCPFIFVSNNFEKLNPPHQKALINHELIHFTQQREMLFIGLIVSSIIESFYYRFIKRRSAWDLYLLLSFEQEAYHNMWDSDYLDRRSRFAHLKHYWHDKPVSWVNVMSNYFKAEGFSEVYLWQDNPGQVYQDHQHCDRVSLYIVKGSIEISINSQVIKLQEGDRYNIPPQTNHSAIVGSEGCSYVVGQMDKRDY